MAALPPAPCQHPPAEATIDTLPSPADADVDPRIARSRSRIRAAAVRLLSAHGYDGVTMEAVAEAAGVGKATLYRHWPSKPSLMIEAVGCLTGHKGDPPPPGTPPRDAVVHSLRGLARVLREGTWGSVMPTLLDAAGRDPELDRLVSDFVGSRRGRLRGTVARAVDTGDLPAGTDVDQAVDLLVGPLFYAAFVRRRALPDDDVAPMVTTVWQGLLTA